MGKIDPFVSWIAEEVEGIQKILRLIAPRYRLLGSDVLTLPPEVAAMGGGQGGGVQRAPNDASGSREWADLPAIKPALGKPPLVAPNRPFAASLAAENPPPPILAPLSHGRGLEAPAGIALGVAKPVAMAAGFADATRGPAIAAPGTDGGRSRRADVRSGGVRRGRSRSRPRAAGRRQRDGIEARPEPGPFERRRCCHIAAGAGPPTARRRLRDPARRPGAALAGSATHRSPDRTVAERRALPSRHRRSARLAAGPESARAG